MTESDSEFDVTKTQSRKWVATLWWKHARVELKGLFKDLTDTGRVRFIAAGAETCPTTGEKHYQTYVVFDKPTRFSYIVRIFGKKMHYAPMYGTLKQNETYCSKESTLEKWGDEPRQGERHDLIGFKRKLEEGLQPEVVAEEEGHFGAYVKHHRGFEKYAHHLRAKKVRVDRTMPKVYIRIGGTRSGKTKWLDDTFGLDGWARMPPPTSSWWITPTVSYSDNVLIDDVGPTKIPPIEELLEWTDRYPVEFNSKGGNLWWKPKNIVITSNYEILEWWKNPDSRHYDALMERIFRIDHIYKDRSLNRVEYPNGGDAGHEEEDQECDQEEGSVQEEEDEHPEESDSEGTESDD
jgi:hypothetical protein